MVQQQAIRITEIQKFSARDPGGKIQYASRGYTKRSRQSANRERETGPKAHTFIKVLGGVL